MRYTKICLLGIPQRTNQITENKCIYVRKDIITATLLPTSISGGGILASFSDSVSISSSTFFTLLLPSSVILWSRSWRSDEASLLIRFDLSVTDILLIEDLQTIAPVTINTLRGRGITSRNKNVNSIKLNRVTKQWVKKVITFVFVTDINYKISILPGIRVQQKPFHGLLEYHTLSYERSILIGPTS